eukprot:352374-Chlamydomonas_euryale.AAC.7
MAWLGPATSSHQHLGQHMECATVRLRRPVRYTRVVVGVYVRWLSVWQNVGWAFGIMLTGR